MADYDDDDEVTQKTSFKSRQGKFNVSTIPLPKPGSNKKKEWYTTTEFLLAVAFFVGLLASYMLAPSCPPCAATECAKPPPCAKCSTKADIDSLTLKMNEWKLKYEDLLAKTDSK